MTPSELFVVSFEHAHRAFRCVRVDNPDDSAASAPGAHWVVTLDSRTVWSFPAQPDDDRERVQETVVHWWDSRTVAR